MGLYIGMWIDRRFLSRQGLKTLELVGEDRDSREKLARGEKRERREGNRRNGEVMGKSITLPAANETSRNEKWSRVNEQSSSVDERAAGYRQGR